jgi:hypothetical protein
MDYPVCEPGEFLTQHSIVGVEVQNLLCSPAQMERNLVDVEAEKRLIFRLGFYLDAPAEAFP